MIRFTTCMAENTDFICREISIYAGNRLGVATEFVNNISWQERERLFDSGEIQVCWICGLPYVWKANACGQGVEILAAPVIRRARYKDLPVYFSDVIVRKESSFNTFADLRQSRWAINEARSHSGYNLVRYHLATIGETGGFFSEVIESGAHQNSLRMIIDGQIDAAAIDSTVLEMELEKDPKLKTLVRAIETLGPSPIPPWVASKTLQSALRESLRALLLNMHMDAEGRELLERARFSRFVAVQDSNYDLIRGMEEKAAQITLSVKHHQSSLKASCRNIGNRYQMLSFKFYPLMLSQKPKHFRT
jgi:phosphonate transport system substrate-binding protein